MQKISCEGDNFSDLARPLSYDNVRWLVLSAFGHTDPLVNELQAYCIAGLIIVCSYVKFFHVVPNLYFAFKSCLLLDIEGLIVQVFKLDSVKFEIMLGASEGTFDCKNNFVADGN